MIQQKIGKTMIKSQLFKSLSKNRNFSKSIFVSGSYQGLLDNNIKGKTTYAEIKKHGNFGLGTFDYVNGEMIAMDNQFYRADKFGLLTPVHDMQKAPLAIVCEFNEEEAEETLLSNASLKDLEQRLLTIKDRHPTESVAMALKINFSADWIKYRSEENEKKETNYDAIMSEQVELRAENKTGTLVGFYFEPQFKKLTSDGFHFHFIDNVRKTGGHLMDVHFNTATAYLEYYTYSQIKKIELESNAHESELSYAK